MKWSESESGTLASGVSSEVSDGSQMKPAFLLLFPVTKFINVAKVLHWFSAIALVLALVGLGVVLIFDTINLLHLTPVHQHAGALSFMLIGVSHVSLLLSLRRCVREIFKELLLGVAFFLWGSEQFVPMGPIATAMDTSVILIFVIDLSLIVLERLKTRGYEAH